MNTYGGSERPDHNLAVVVGAGAMGMAVARRLSQRHRLLLADLDGAKAEAQAASLRGEGCDATAIACDVTSREDVAALARAVEDRGGPGVLAHVAGLSPSASDFHQIMRVNLMGAAWFADALLPLARQGSAAILIASLAAHSYAPTPEAEDVLREPAAPDLADRLAAVLGDQATPGMIATPMGAREFEANEHKRRLFGLTPLKREGTMLEIANAVEFLASDRASFISGTDLLVDGGLAGTMASLDRNQQS